MTIRCYIVLLFISISTQALAQKKDSEASIQNIKDEVSMFLNANKLFTSEKKSSLVITELLDVSTVGYHKIGIYGVGAHISHSPSFIMLKRNNKIRVLDPKNINKSFKILIKFLNKYIESETDRNTYIMKVSQIFNDNLNNILVDAKYKYAWKRI